MKNKKGKDWIGRIPKWAWLLISLATAVLVWQLLSMYPRTERTFRPLLEVFASAQTMYERGVLFQDIINSLISAIGGFAFGFVLAVPIAFLMAWYRPVRFIVEPWIQFIRNILDRCHFLAPFL